MTQQIGSSPTATGAAPPARTNPRWARVAFYGGFGVLLAAMVAKQLDVLLAPGLATQVGHNSEAVCLALLLCAMVEGVRRYDRLTGPRALALLGCAALLLVITVLLVRSDLPSSVRTLNEATGAAAVLGAYLALPRPLPRAVPVLLAAALVLVIWLANSTALVTLQAESMMSVLVGVVAFDLVDRRILEPAVRDRPALRRGWYVLLIAVPLLFIALRRVELAGDAYAIVRYMSRTTEAFLALLVVHLYLGTLPRALARGPGHRQDVVHA